MDIAANNGPSRGQVELVRRMTRPVPNPDRVAARANARTHRFITSIDPTEERCMDCDCRPTHTAAEYPCGTKVPRQVVAYFRAA